MNKENLEKIVTDLDDLKNLVEFFSTQEEIPPIEIDIVKRKLQDIYMQFSESFENSRKTKNEISHSAITKVKNEKTVETPKAEPEFEIKRENEEREDPKKTVDEKEEIIHEKQEDKAPEKPKQPSKSGTTLSDKLKGNNVSLNDRLSNNKSSDLSSRLKKGPIKDLNEAIGLNDKFSYIRTLFGGDAHKFRESIDQFNSMQSISEAENYISSNFNWDMEETTTQQFLDLIHRKIQSNG